MSSREEILSQLQKELDTLLVDYNKNLDKLGAAYRDHGKILDDIVGKNLNGELNKKEARIKIRIHSLSIEQGDLSKKINVVKAKIKTIEQEKASC